MKIDLSSLVENKLRSHVANIRSTSGRLQFRCPICGDSKKSRRKARCNYYPATDTFYCWNCGRAGDGVFLLSHILHKPYSDVKAELITSSNIKLSTAIQSIRTLPKKIELDLLKINDLEETNRQFAALTTDLPEKALEFLDDRLILDAPFIDPNFKFYWSEQTSRIVIPWYYGKHIIYYQARTILPDVEPKYLFPQSCHTTFFGLNSVDFSIPYVFFLEGAFNSMFVKNGVALGSLNFSGLQKLLIAELFKNHEQILMVDNPFVDNSARLRILKMIKNGYSGKIFIPPKELRKYKDVNDAVKATKSVSAFASLDFLLENSFGPAKIMAELMQR